MLSVSVSFRHVSLAVLSYSNSISSWLDAYLLPTVFSAIVRTQSALGWASLLPWCCTLSRCSENVEVSSRHVGHFLSPSFLSSFFVNISIDGRSLFSPWQIVPIWEFKSMLSVIQFLEVDSLGQRLSTSWNPLKKQHITFHKVLYSNQWGVRLPAPFYAYQHC